MSGPDIDAKPVPSHESTGAKPAKNFSAPSGFGLPWMNSNEHRDCRSTGLVERAHTIPGFPLNELLAAIFSAETPLGHWLPFSWGTSIPGVFQKG